MWNQLDVFQKLQGGKSTWSRERGAQQLGGRGEMGRRCDWRWVGEIAESQIMLGLDGHGHNKGFRFHAEIRSHY